MSGLFGNKFNIVNESKVYSDSNICIFVDGSGETERNYYQNPYIKVFNAENRAKSNKAHRIYIKDPQYEESHGKLDGKDFWVLNSAERKMLDKIMDKTSKSGKTVFEDILDMVAAESHKSDIPDIPRPDFKTIKR